MKTKPFLVGSLLATIASFLIGFLWYVVIFKDTYQPGDDSNMVLIFVSMLVAAGALAAVYEKWSGGTYNLAGGAKLGAIVGLIPGLSTVLMMYATKATNDTMVIVLEAAYGVIAFGVMGAIIAFVYSKMG